ncbi:hypothetical protein KSP40_PGU017949 [Platanthera guangdongensis]|uniref:Uncharacterized protein n=1 Tax=Platanthera guangdongensis TaxID=2320717 RepID=A0ABR2LZM9_9ASPA
MKRGIRKPTVQIALSDHEQFIEKFLAHFDPLWCAIAHYSAGGKHKVLPMFHVLGHREENYLLEDAIENECALDDELKPGADLDAPSTRSLEVDVMSIGTQNGKFKGSVHF